MKIQNQFVEIQYFYQLFQLDIDWICFDQSMFIFVAISTQMSSLQAGF